VPMPKTKKLSLADIRAMPQTGATNDLLRDYMRDPENWSDLQQRLATDPGPVPAEDTEDQEADDGDK